MAAIELEDTSLRSDANLVSYWRLNNAITDELGTNNLTSGSSTDTATAKFGTARDYEVDSGHFDYINSATHPTGNSAFTICFWFRFESAAADRVMFMMGLDGGTPTGVGIYIESTDSSLKFEWPSASITCNEGVTLTADTWYHVAAVYSGSKALLYRNGSEVATTTTSSSNISAGRIGLGAWMTGDSTGAAKHDGILDDVALFNRDLTATEVSNLYNGTWPAGGHNLTLLGVGT